MTEFLKTKRNILRTKITNLHTAISKLTEANAATIELHRLRVTEYRTELSIVDATILETLDASLYEVYLEEADTYNDDCRAIMVMLKLLPIKEASTVVPDFTITETPGKFGKVLSPAVIRDVKGGRQREMEGRELDAGTHFFSSEAEAKSQSPPMEGTERDIDATGDPVFLVPADAQCGTSEVGALQLPVLKDVLPNARHESAERNQTGTTEEPDASESRSGAMRSLTRRKRNELSFTVNKDKLSPTASSSFSTQHQVGRWSYSPETVFPHWMNRHPFKWKSLSQQGWCVNDEVLTPRDVKRRTA